MLARTLLFLNTLNMYYFRILSENNDTLVKANTTSSLQKTRAKTNDEKDNKGIYVFGLPIYVFILICMLSLALFMIIIAKLWCLCDKYRKKNNKKGENKEKDNKKIELSKINKDYNFGHIYISSLD